MNNEYLKGVLDAKISRFLSEADYLTYSQLSGGEKLSFFINAGLVSTSVVTNFEALSKHALNDLKNEVNEYVGEDKLYVTYFFATDYVKKESGALPVFLNERYTEAKSRNDEALLYFMDYDHAVKNIMHILRALTRKDAKEDVFALFLEQSIMDIEVFSHLLGTDRATIFSYVKQTFNVDLDINDPNTVVEEKLDRYVVGKIKEFAVESDLAPTLIYYIKMKQQEILRLREIYYAKRNVAHG